MLDISVDEIVMEDGKVVGVRSGRESAKCKKVYHDPTYCPGMVKKKGHVVVYICLLDHPLTNNNGSLSSQIIIPQKQSNRMIYCTF